jgi:hypothetical protein
MLGGFISQEAGDAIVRGLFVVTLLVGIFVMVITWFLIKYFKISNRVGIYLYIVETLITFSVIALIVYIFFLS